MVKQKRSKFWYITHIAAVAMLIVTVFGAVAMAFAAF
ncbi:DUF4044 domain-containing protein [Lacticaseibacillus absianus]|nr:DUF4044 domain-containing protein [Lacticaseibacillus absianus]